MKGRCRSQAVHTLFWKDLDHINIEPDIEKGLFKLEPKRSYAWDWRVPIRRRPDYLHVSAGRVPGHPLDEALPSRSGHRCPTCRGQDHPHRAVRSIAGSATLIRVALRTGSLLVGHHRGRLSNPRVSTAFRGKPDQNGNEAILACRRGGAQVLTGWLQGAARGTGAHVEYWIGRSWCTLVWLRSSASDNSRITLRLTEAGRRELAVWQNRRAGAWFRNGSVVSYTDAPVPRFRPLHVSPCARQPTPVR